MSIRRWNYPLDRFYYRLAVLEVLASVNCRALFNFRDLLRGYMSSVGEGENPWAKILQPDSEGDTFSSTSGAVTN